MTQNALLTVKGYQLNGGRYKNYSYWAIFIALYLSAILFGCGGGGGGGTDSSSTPSTSDYVIPNIAVDASTYVFRANTVDEETDFILQVLQRYQFYQTNGYRISLPNHPVVTNLINKAQSNIAITSSDRSDLQNAMLGIYNSSDYQAGLAKLNEYKTKILSCFPAFLDYAVRWHLRGWTFKIFPTYTVCLTLYGTGGNAYPQTGKIILFTNPSGTFGRGVDPTPTLMHETTHIAIWDEVNTKYNIAHWVSERIVDKFVYYHFHQVLPADFYLQSSGDVSIDPYLAQPDSWERLPDYVGRYVSGLPPKFF